MQRAVILALASLLMTHHLLLSAEIHVRKDGDDGRSGKSREEAFATVGKGLEAMQAGDELIIGPGEYHEGVKRKALGEKGKTTLIRAERPGTAVLRGDVEAPEFRPVPGYRFVWVGPFEGEVQAVNEADQLRILQRQPNIDELEFNPGSYHHDPKEGKLYISSTDLQGPGEHYYTVSVIRESGLQLESPTGVRIEGLEVRGFNLGVESRGYGVDGIRLIDATDCVVSNCRAYLNGGGITIRSGKKGGGNVIEKSEAYANDYQFGSEGGNIIVYRPNHDVIRDSMAYCGTAHGIRLYDVAEGPGLIERCIAWDNEGGDLWTKGIGMESRGRVSRSIATGQGNIHQVESSIIGTGNLYQTAAQERTDTVRLQKEQIDEEQEYADPWNLDYRLQSTSKLRKSGPEGSDRGPYPYEANVFYVGNAGNDEADGLSVKGAWKSPAKAVEKLREGDTLYILAGTYPEKLEIRNAKGVSIRGRGKERPTLTGPVTLTGAEGVDFQRLTFDKKCSVEEGKKVAFRNCLFKNDTEGLRARKAEALSIRHCTFEGFRKAGVALDESRNAVLSGNFFRNDQAPAIVIAGGSAEETLAYCDYNAYADGANLLRVGDATHGMTALPGRYSRVVAEGLSGRGPGGKAFGVEPSRRSRQARLTPPLLHSVTATTANLEWMSSLPATFSVTWGETPECRNKARLDTGMHAQFSLTGLQPETTYYFKIHSVELPANMPGKDRVMPAPTDRAVLQFTTLRENRPASNYYVAPDGEDGNDGRSRKTAWKTIRRAANSANAGDTVWVAGGTYREQVRIRATGAEDLPITFRSLPGEKVILDGDRKSLETAFTLIGKNHIVIDGFYLENFGKPQEKSFSWPSWDGGLFKIFRSGGVIVSRCFYDGRGPGYSPGFLRAFNSPDLTIRNCVAINPFSTVFTVYDSPGFRFEHNVILRNMIQTGIVWTYGAGTHLNRNIFTDNLERKSGVQLLTLIDDSGLEMVDNCFFLRRDDDRRKPLSISSGKADRRRMSVADFCQSHPGATALVKDPGFAIFRSGPLSSPDAKQPYPVDRLLQNGVKLDFPDLFATDEEAVARKIGLVPGDFEKFHFQKQSALLSRDRSYVSLSSR